MPRHAAADHLMIAAQRMNTVCIFRQKSLVRGDESLPGAREPPLPAMGMTADSQITVQGFI